MSLVNPVTKETYLLNFIHEKSAIFESSRNHGKFFREINDRESFLGALKELRDNVRAEKFVDSTRIKATQELDKLERFIPRLASLSLALRVINAGPLANEQALLWGGIFSVIQAAFRISSAPQARFFRSNIKMRERRLSECKIIVDATRTLPPFENFNISPDEGLSPLEVDANEIENRTFPNGPISAVYFAYVHFVGQSFLRVSPRRFPPASEISKSALSGPEILDRAYQIFTKFAADREVRSRYADMILRREDENVPRNERLALLQKRLLQFELEKEKGHEEQRLLQRQLRYTQSWHNFDSTILSLVIFGTLVGAVLTTIAGYNQPQPPAPGKRDDMDFWLTIQATIISWVNVLIMIIPTVQKSHLPIQNWGWTWLFWASSLVTSTVASACYTSLRPIYSASLLYAASVAQMLVILQLLANVDELAREHMSAV